MNNHLKRDVFINGFLQKRSELLKSSELCIPGRSRLQTLLTLLAGAYWYPKTAATHFLKACWRDRLFPLYSFLWILLFCEMTTRYVLVGLQSLLLSLLKRVRIS
jgi:hypothetical protein